ncbi:Ethylene-responsive transcription factor [Thalictrum thalictroides]|uniref:Ethylene-responsive transcription factor n=1 Tax=Thalictrum thalictroides TaxID=46969 RepID=A0A7J6WUY9_THATH|nr:Ethylene-responsive transcription factor [Thalictrum thalictroides]
MGSASKKPRTGDLKRGKADANFKGVRMRTWGTWVSEIRKPQSKERIWLGSFDAPEKAARAYDAALYCLRGSQGKFNFPDDERPQIPDTLLDPLSTTEIKAIAARFASSECISVLSSTSVFPTINPPEVVDRTAEEESTFDVDSLFVSEFPDQDTFFSDSFILDELITFEPDSIWAVLEETENLSAGK